MALRTKEAAFINLRCITWLHFEVYIRSHRQTSINIYRRNSQHDELCRRRFWDLESFYIMHALIWQGKCYNVFV